MNRYFIIVLFLITIVTLFNSCTYNTIQPFCPKGVIEIIEEEVINESCDQENGRIMLTATGDNGDLSFSIDSINFQPTGKFENLSAGIYNVQIVDNTGCFLTRQFKIDNESFDLSLNFVLKASKCGLSDGSITVLTNNNTDSLMFSINGGADQIDSVFNNLTPDTYLITVRNKR